jgi:hypothetical protein
MRVCDMGGGVSSSGVPAPLVGIAQVDAALQARLVERFLGVALLHLLPQGDQDARARLAVTDCS